MQSKYGWILTGTEMDNREGYADAHLEHLPDGRLGTGR
jgi:hypothetical protein